MMGFGWNQYGASCHSGFGGIGMMLGGLLLVGLLIYGLVVLVRREHAPAYPNAANYPDRNAMNFESALSILDERYARGEMSDEEYTKRKSELKRR